ncbi:MAG: hypothetical protein QM736_10180 [Vicinamibacterales bacterium]
MSRVSSSSFLRSLDIAEESLDAQLSVDHFCPPGDLDPDTRAIGAGEANQIVDQRAVRGETFEQGDA